MGREAPGGLGLMGTFDDLSVGERFSSPERTIDEPSARAIVEAGGYTHPLFTDPAYAERSPFGRAPLPGQGILLVMGGLAEQSGRFDETVIALTGFDDVRFKKPAFAGDAVRLDVEVVAKEQKGDGKGLLVMAWRCARGEDILVEATARMLFRV